MKGDSWENTKLNVHQQSGCGISQSESVPLGPSAVGCKAKPIYDKFPITVGSH